MKKYLSIALITGGLALLGAAPAIAAPSAPSTLGLLAAGERTSVLTETTGNITTSNNGTAWYYSLDRSMGFVLDGVSVNLNTADTSFGDEDWSRLSWHLRVDVDTDYVDDGYRLGANQDLNLEDLEDFDTEADYLTQESTSTGRFIFTADVLPGYYPSGPQENVGLSDLDGWTLCWSNLYADSDSSVDALDDIWAACDGTYLMLAGGSTATDDTGGTEGLATTGGDSGWILGAAIALIGAGTVVAVRRRRA
jgi:hypothetical protein